MSQVSIAVGINVGGDITINIFNDFINYQHYFPNGGTWNADLTPGDYLISMAGTVAPTGRITVSFAGTASVQPTNPIAITSSGPFVCPAAITV